MSRLLFAWERGANLGHVAHIQPAQAAVLVGVTSMRRELDCPETDVLRKAFGGQWRLLTAFPERRPQHSPTRHRLHWASKALAMTGQIMLAWQGIPA